MTSSNGNIFRVTDPLCGEFTGDRWIPLTKASDVGLGCFFVTGTWTNGWVNNRDAGDLRRHRAHYDVTVMVRFHFRRRSYIAETRGKLLVVLWRNDVFEIINICLFKTHFSDRSRNSLIMSSRALNFQRILRKFRTGFYCTLSICEKIGIGLTKNFGIEWVTGHYLKCQTSW